jgi:outer membrane receptor protein involved in Fe transport
MNYFFKGFVLAMLFGSLQNAFGQDGFILSTDSTIIPPVELETIEVTATKEKHELQQLPMAASVINGLAIEEQEMTSLTSLTSTVPNLFMPDYGSKLTSPIYIRGIGSRINSPSVGLYVDGVPYFEKAAFQFEFYDIEKIEVLRGPQGTLYGRNTMGGIIDIRTKKPARQRSTWLRLNAGNYESYKIVFGHNQPLSHNLSLLVNGAFVDRNGYNTNEFTGQPADDLRSWSGRVRMQWVPTADVELDYSLNFENSDQAGYPYAVYDDSTNTAAPVNYNQKSTYYRDMLSNNLTLKITKADKIFKSVTSHQYFDDLQKIDQDFTPKSLFFVTQDQQQHMISEELNFYTNPEYKSDYQWLCGAFAFGQFLDRKVAVAYGEDAVAAYGLPGAIHYDKGYDQRTYGIAFFHQSTFYNFILDNLSLTAGIRFDYEKASLDYTYDRFLETQNIGQETFNSELDFWEILPGISLKYDFSQQVNAYFNLKKGYKTGGFNSSFEREQDRTFDPETSWNYELGFKSRYFHNRLQTNLNIFYIDWKHQQIYQPVIDSAGQTQPGSMLKNAGRSESKGIELEFRGLPSTHTEAYLSFGYTDATFVDYKDGSDDFSGNRIPYIPEYSFNLGFTYDHVLNYPWLDKVMFQADYKGVGKHFWQEENISWQNYYGLLNGKISFCKSDFCLSFWGKNMLNEDYQAFYFQALGNSYVQVGRPAYFGVKLDMKF